jgi:hypothetical protein
VNITMFTNVFLLVGGNTVSAQEDYNAKNTCSLDEQLERRCILKTSDAASQHPYKGNM